VSQKYKHPRINELSDTATDTGSIFEEMEAEESWKAIQLDQVSSTDPLIQVIPLTLSTTKSPPPVENNKPETTIEPADIQNIDGFFNAQLGFPNTPSLPHSSRSLEELQENVADVWDMSASERRQIHNFWTEQARVHLGLSYMDDFQRLRDRHARKLQQCDENKAEVH